MLKWAEKTSNRETRPSSLAGYLWKMKRKHKLHLPQWNKRWFSIEGKLLKWYAKEDSKKESGQISLVVCFSITLSSLFLFRILLL